MSEFTLRGQNEFILSSLFTRVCFEDDFELAPVAELDIDVAGEVDVPSRSVFVDGCGLSRCGLPGFARSQ